MDFALARRQMVDGQLRPSRVSSPALLEAFRTIPRERFLPGGLASRAYGDQDIAIAPDRALLAPMALARLLQLAAPRASESALIAGAGSGYGAALLAALGLRVTAVEADPALRQSASAALAGTDPPVTLVAGPPAEGCASAAPFDVILIEGEVPAVPNALVEQLAPGGRLVAVLATDGRHGRAVLGQRAGGTFSLTQVFDLAAAPVPGFAAPATFVL